MMQHASDAFVADWKTTIVRTALAAQGLEADLRPIITSPPRSRRRATLAARRTKGGVLMGFHSRASDVLVGVPECQLLHPDLIGAFPALEAIVKLGGSRSQEMDLAITRVRPIYRGHCWVCHLRPSEFDPWPLRGTSTRNGVEMATGTSRSIQCVQLTMR